jgi:hypothetical protein
VLQQIRQVLQQIRQLRRHTLLSPDIDQPYPPDGATRHQGLQRILKNINNVVCLPACPDCVYC